MTRVKSPLRYHGGKAYLAKKIVDLMPEHSRYLEAFSGGLSVLLAKPEDQCAEWVNDANGELTNFWRVLASPDTFTQFHRQIKFMPLNEAEFKMANLLPDMQADRIDRAVAFFIRNRMSRQGLSKDYCTPTSRLRRGMNENVSAWLSAVDGLEEVYYRLRRVEVWNRPAVDAIQDLDCTGLLVYADPPYISSTRSSKGEYGDHEMDDEDHWKLLDTLANIKGKFMLSGYDNRLYQHSADKHGWNCHKFELPNNASSAKSKERKTECLWCNF